MKPTESENNEPLDDKAKSALKVVFITLFLDLIGFSIIFPLFPAMLDYYLTKEGDSGLIGAVVRGLETFSQAAGGPSDMGIIILFGGVLASLFSFLQFVCSPIIGALSDKYGRKPILLISIAGIAVSYGLWFFAGAFWLLCVSRIIGGLMSGNISTATAVVADVTSVKNRSKGMALVGMAFGIGFIIGPAIGGFSAMIDLTEHFASWANYGVNPFSMPALIAFALAIFNFVWVLTKFEETLPESSDDNDRVKRSFNPIKLFATEAYPGVTRTNLTNFIFLTAFSGMEFSLTFLALDRLDFGPRQNAYMFLFIGLILALVQGGYVRRKAPIIGSKRMALQGFVMVIPGLVFVGMAQSVGVLYLGLFLMAVGSAQVIPCLTALASSYAPANEQGRILGVFRSLGALARGVGPLLACLLYWRLGSAISYYIGAVAIILPIMLTAKLPPVKE
ncbi:MAG: MFS transporter [Candidatus Hydrogenedentota bacterium]|nr:MAG: MFS transporter [Candidatus Hydrogenedentota bacterium]